MLERSPTLFASQVGHEYLLTFVCQAQIGGKYDRAIKKLLVGYKQRDTLDKSKRSVFYCLIAKTLQAVTEVPEQRALRILSTTAADLRANPDFADIQTATTEELARLQLLSKITKIFHNAVILIVNV